MNRTRNKKFLPKFMMVCMRNRETILQNQVLFFIKCIYIHKASEQQTEEDDDEME